MYLFQRFFIYLNNKQVNYIKPSPKNKVFSDYGLDRRQDGYSYTVIRLTKNVRLFWVVNTKNLRNQLL